MMPSDISLIDPPDNTAASGTSSAADQLPPAAEPDPPFALPQNHAVVLFDGVCNVCNGSVNFIIDHDPQAYFKFASLQSEVGQQILAQFDLPRSDFDTMILIENGKCSKKSTAALGVARHLSFPWSIGGIGLIVPSFLRDLAYSLIARNRYKWFGKQDQCRIPTPAIRARFLG